MNPGIRLKTTVLSILWMAAMAPHLCAGTPPLTQAKAGPYAHPAALSIWDGAYYVHEPTYYLHLDWFGRFHHVGNWRSSGYLIHHDEQTWLFCDGNGPDDILMYDVAAGLWGWMSKATYPWIYWHAPARAWTRYTPGSGPADRIYYEPVQGDWYRDHQLRLIDLPEPDYAPLSVQTAEVRFTVDAATFYGDLGTSVSIMDFSAGQYTYTRKSPASADISYTNLLGLDGTIRTQFTGTTTGTFYETFSGYASGFMSGSFVILSLNQSLPQYAPHTLNEMRITVTVTDGTHEDDLGNETFTLDFSYSNLDYTRTSAATCRITYRGLDSYSGYYDLEFDSPTTGTFYEDYSGGYSGYNVGTFQIHWTSP